MRSYRWIRWLLAGSLLAAWVAWTRKVQRDGDARLDAELLERRFGEKSRDKVEETSWESFPASDPPGRY